MNWDDFKRFRLSQAFRVGLDNSSYSTTRLETRYRVASLLDSLRSMIILRFLIAMVFPKLGHWKPSGLIYTSPLHLLYCVKSSIFTLFWSLMMMTAVRTVTMVSVARVRMPRISRTSDLVIMASAASREGQGRSKLVRYWRMVMEELFTENTKGLHD